MANNMIGKRFERLVVEAETEPKIYPGGQKKRMFECLCDCGNTTIVGYSNLMSGKTRSCGCLHKEIIGSLNRTHGLSGNKCGRLYPLWKSIRYRCYSPSSKDYDRYGGRGIVMCDEWKDDFITFYDWSLANGYKEEKTNKGLNVLTIDRIDVNGNYEPGNCRFVTNSVQATNKRNTLNDEERYAICPICGKQYQQTQRNGTKTCSRKCGEESRIRTRFAYGKA